MRIFLLLLLLAPLAPGEIIDRIAVTVGDRVITESELLEEIRVTAFLEGQKPDLSPDAKRKTADRLVEQTLIRREAEFTRIQLPAMTAIAGLLEQVEAKYASPQQFREALQTYGITEEQLKQHLLWQLRLVSFIDIRFRPGVQLSEADLRDYYEHQVADWKAKSETTIPTFDQARPQIEEALSAERANRALDRWLGEARTQTDIVYHKKAFE